ncbi:transporter, major intrinsic protein (MIP) superfamily protein [Acanthamoeba castellanii str. Neff]|uniref:Transporter, major intrinsic protein (MIP) superfamily protein n=1 Tax=Acanthamoeba castellanii (strain ATCC 30010 / Neff) TaxID=1257118 RepID=L8HCR2_ACACF|nr:transporter, major intrinsic protein (MIP) superfamily protein [Acanthamoeba castellanii str. Neff]ELR22156.1 transporter, major intrinsic protein (MIP) superfamily protein [Acanthamoeba castellanii str. Neff]
MSVVQRLTAAFRTNPTERAHLLTSTAGGCIQQPPLCLGTGEEEGGLRATALHVTDDELRHLKDFTTSEPLASQEAASACTAENLCSSRVWLYGDRQTWQDWGISLWSEFLGTFLMVFVGCGIGVRGATKEVNSMAFFLVIIFIVEAFVPFSGAHFNPVVSLVMFLSGVTCLSLLVLHTLVQCFAATVASYLMLLLLPETEKMNCAVTTVQEAWHNPMGIWKAICMEAIMTGVLIYVILTTGLHSKSKERNALSTLAVACTVATLILLGGDLTGTSMNPARSLGPAIACGYWQYQWIYFVGPPIGAVLAWVSYTLTHHKI